MKANRRGKRRELAKKERCKENRKQERMKEKYIKKKERKKKASNKPREERRNSGRWKARGIWRQKMRKKETDLEEETQSKKSFCSRTHGELFTWVIPSRTALYNDTTIQYNTIFCFPSL